MNFDTSYHVHQEYLYHAPLHHVAYSCHGRFSGLLRSAEHVVRADLAKMWMKVFIRISQAWTMKIYTPKWQKKVILAKHELYCTHWYEVHSKGQFWILSPIEVHIAQLECLPKWQFNPKQSCRSFVMLSNLSQCPKLEIQTICLLYELTLSRCREIWGLGQ